MSRDRPAMTHASSRSRRGHAHLQALSPGAVLARWLPGRGQRRLWILLLYAGVLLAGCGHGQAGDHRQAGAPTPRQVTVSASAPATADQLFLEARRRLRGGDGPGAVVVARRALKLDPCHTGALDLAVAFYEDQGRAAESTGVLKKACDAGCARPEHFFALGKAYIALDQPRQALAAFQQVVARDSSQASAYNNIASLYARMSNVGQTIAALEKALQIDSTYVPAHYNLGVAYAENGDYQRGVEALQAALRLDSLHLEANLHLATLYNDMGRHRRAVTLLRRALDVDSTSAAVYYQLGVARARMGQAAQAMAAYRRTLDLDPAFVQAYYRLGQLQLRSGDRDAGVATMEDFQRWQQRAARDPALWRRIAYLHQASATESGRQLAHFQLGMLYAREGWVEEAVREYRSTLTCNPRHRPALRRLGMLLLKEKRLSEAATIYEQMVELWPEDTAAWNNLCIAHMAAGHQAQALSSFQKALALHPDAPSLYVNLGTLHMQRHELSRADAAFRRALELAPEDARLRQAVRRLSEDRLGKRAGAGE